MIETELLCQFIQNTRFSENILSGHFLPDNNNMAFVDSNNVATVVVLDNTATNKPTVAAYGAMHVCASNQAYLMFCECDAKYTEKSVTIKKCKYDEYSPERDGCRQRCWQICNIYDKDIDYSRLPEYFGAFEDRYQQHLLVHVYDQLVNATIKTYNMDMCKNVTVDLYDIDFTDKTRWLYRDMMGFMVTDKKRYFEITINKSDLRAITENKRTKSSDVSYMELNSENQLYFSDYDSMITVVNRHDFLEFLWGIDGMLGIVAVQNQQPIGYILALNNHILQCYADTSDIACYLVCEISGKLSEEVPITMFMRECSDWICSELLEKAQKIHRIHRFHSRILPTRVKWESVFLMNIGTNLC
ncbi:unnamed protein product [Thelazia callipaeda]|uniref:DUF2156 domain-containing protein n=1 Tax=Thelazia callipaeda TaxID=103827 RepID=A0A0N5D2J5_THECL|nr:unnamed protein product [Thelazia callipaeda]